MTLALERNETRAPSVRWTWIAAVPAVTILVLMALWPALIGVPFWDDLYSLIAIDIAAGHARPAFSVTGDTMAFWRPVELFLIALLRPIDPVGFLGVKLASFALHALKAVATVLLVRRLAPALPLGVGIMAGLIALAHPIAVPAIIQIDTVSEASAACAIAWAFLAVLDAVSREGAARRLRLVGAAAFATIALFSKESAVPAVLALPLVAFIAAPDRRAVFRDLAWFAVLLAATIAVFVGLRFSLGFGTPATTDGRYNVAFGPNIVKNLAVVAGSLSFFGNTVELIGNRHPAAAIGFVPLLVGIAMVAWALLKRRAALFGLLNGRIALAAVILALAATAAPSLAPAISEHNAALPSSAALGLGLALVGAAAMTMGQAGLRIGAVAGMLAIAFGVTAMMAKSDAAAATGHQAAELRAEIDRFLYGHDRLRICVVPNEGRGYSIYQLPAERSLEGEVSLARHTWPAKDIDAMQAPADRAGCDMTIPNFPAKS